MLDALLDLVLPRACPGCALPGTRFCPRCRALLQALPVPAAPTPRPPGLPPMVAVGPYDGALRQLLVAHKERAALHLTRPLGRALATAVLALGPGPTLLCPVPSSSAAVRARGHDHALRVARAAAAALRRTGVEAVAQPLLRPARATADQAGLSAAQRAANLHGAFVAVRSGASRVVVVDDVMTTGATLAEAARALSLAGYDVVGGAVVAATRRRVSATSR